MWKCVVRWFTSYVTWVKQTPVKIRKGLAIGGAFSVVGPAAGLPSAVAEGPIGGDAEGNAVG